MAHYRRHVKVLLECVPYIEANPTAETLVCKVTNHDDHAELSVSRCLSSVACNAESVGMICLHCLLTMLHSSDWPTQALLYYLANGT